MENTSGRGTSRRISTLSRSVEDRRAIVTGAASGMGRATAHLFADEGARVVVADLGEDRVAAVVGEINEVHGEKAALGVVCDVAERAQLVNLVERTVEWAGGIDILVNNAGISVPNDSFQEEDEFEAVWAHTMDVNVTSQARLVRYALPYLLAAGGGRIVNIASTEAIMSMAGLMSYSASKAGVTGLTKSLAVELGSRDVTVNCICPGPIRTAMTERFPDEKKEVYARRRVPVRRYGIPEEVAQMTLNLCLPASSYVNGVVIPVDGGLTIRHI
ncbi:SDR family NAD(P)-dependent oxidoreductase [Nocardioides campestrisoli]|uniref:SDR family NAD(P)-dependent oxidoreductase n=1 Tax=Nocardioides campestrisoli TaxID=2736757 RepID=UPI00163D70AE|nr:SDR family NAD(P)-dependent oxidoreductase [Nocardioides campestrisoli]